MHGDPTDVIIAHLALAGVQPGTHLDAATVDVCDVLQRAADYFKQHPELNVVNAAWQTTVDMEGRVGFAFELEVIPPGYYPEDIPIK